MFEKKKDFVRLHEMFTVVRVHPCEMWYYIHFYTFNFG